VFAEIFQSPPTCLLQVTFIYLHMNIHNTGLSRYTYQTSPGKLCEKFTLYCNSTTWLLY